VLLVFGAPRQLESLGGQEHGRTIQLADSHTSITNNAATTEVKAIVKYGDATIAIQTHWTDLTRDD
jgi:hypothetical protein